MDSGENLKSHVGEDLRRIKLKRIESIRRPLILKSDLIYFGAISLFILLQFVVQCISFSVRDQSLLSRAEKSLSVDYYEPVFYNPSELISQHSRKKRELGNKESLKFNLYSKSRNFRVNLNEDKSVFHPDVLIENSDGPIAYDTSRILSGHLEDEPGSYIEGLVTSSGHFDGVISLPSGQEFHIEPSHRYTLGHPNGSQGIIYEQDSIQWPSEPPICASHELHLNRKEETSSDQSDDHLTHSDLKTRQISKPLNSSHSHHKRTKRFILDPKRKTCMLYLQADHLFFQHFGSEESAINMMARHIQRVNEIYKSTDFDGDGNPDGISFMIKRIKVHSLSNALDPSYRYNGDFQVIKYLERFSEGDYESFCLAYMFTFRDFEGGTLGLAWTGDLKNAGGVCERKGHFRGGLKSLNTGIITLLNYGKVVLPAVSYVTLAHEIGHNFGSPHDPESDKECVPGGKDGNYIMYARATAGDQKNNQRFSPCSLRSILPVLNAKAKNTHGCFTEPQQAICGNREVEQGEECDCGWEEDCTEPCCYPMKLRFDPKETPCTLRPRKECSPSQGPCCTPNCTLKIKDKCREDNGCRHQAFCDGYMPACPPSVHKPNRTVCHEEQNVCFMGECTGSICLAYGLESCQCSPQPWDSASKMCELCCKLPGEGQPCKSSFEWNDAPYDVPDLFAKPGSPCKNYTGYCDSYRSCREVDPSGPLATLRNLLLADEGLTAIAEWIDTHWYAVISFIALLIVMMVLTAKMCGKEATKKLRKITVMHSNVDAIQVERSYWDESGEHVVHPAAVRKKIPLRKKIREKKNKGKNRTKTKTPRLSSGENKAPRYGTLWRKKRAERARLNSTGALGNQKTEINNGTLNGDLAQSPNNPQSLQTFDLVQLQTPPVTSGGKSIYPTLVISDPVPGPSGSSGGPSTSSKSPSAGANNNLNNGGKGTNADPLSAALVNHEPKTVILPQAGRRKRRSNSKRPSGEQQRSKDARKSGGSKPHRVQSGSSPQNKSKSPGVTPTSQGGPSSSSRSRKATTPGGITPGGKEKKSKKGIQIVYTPPFSVKVVQVDNPTLNGANSNKSEPTIRGNKSSPIAPEMPKPETSRAPLSNGANKSNNNSRGGGASGSSKSPHPVVDTSGPPPYSKIESAGGGDVTPVPAKAIPPHMVKSKVKSSGSFLQRRKQNLKSRSKNNEKSELRVLIPPANLDDDDVTTPVTPHT